MVAITNPPGLEDLASQGRYFVAVCRGGRNKEKRWFYSVSLASYLALFVSSLSLNQFRYHHHHLSRSLSN